MENSSNRIHKEVKDPILQVSKEGHTQDARLQEADRCDRDADVNFLQLDTTETNEKKSHLNEDFVTICSLYKNLAVICSSFLLLFSAFQSLQNLQSSLNIAEGLGGIGLTIIYSSLILSSLFLPPLFLSRIGMKWTMVLSTITYLGYIAASFHAAWATIIPTSIFLGIGAANLWTGQMAYVTKLAGCYSSVSRIKAKAATNTFFGIFFASFHTADVWGNLASSLVFRKSQETNVTGTNFSCGATFCPLEETANPNLIIADRKKIYIYSGICVACAVLAVLLMALLLDNLKLSLDKKLSPLKLMTSSIRHFKKSGYQKLLAPATVYRGFSAGFIIADFNAAFTSCTLGVDNVGFIMICYGLSCSIAAFLFGRLTRWTGYMIPFLISFVLHSAIGITFFIWTPRKDSQFIFYLCVSIWAVGYSVYSSLLSSLYGNLFLQRPEAAMSCFRVFDSIGWALSFGLSSFMCANIKLALVLILLVISTVLVLVLLVHRKNAKKRELS